MINRNFDKVYSRIDKKSIGKSLFFMVLQEELTKKPQFPWIYPLRRMDFSHFFSISTLKNMHFVVKNSGVI
jgi:hypothetical protein